METNKPKTIKTVLLIFAFIISGLCVFYVVSLYPTIWSLRIGFSITQYTSHENIDVIKENLVLSENLSYPSYRSNNKFDLIYPIDDTDEAYPTIIWVHGGAFVAGDKNETNDYLCVVSDYGYAVINMNYEIDEFGSYPTPIIQIGELVTYLMENKDDYPMLDLNNIILGGDSAGAHIVSQYALIQTNLDYSNLVNIEQTLDKSLIKGIILYSGVYEFDYFKTVMESTNFLDLEFYFEKVFSFFVRRVGVAYLNDDYWYEKNWDILNIKNYVTSDFPSTIITDGNTLSFETQAKELVSVLKEKDVDVVELFFDATLYHEFQFSLATTNKDGNNYGLIVLDELILFLDSVLND